VIRVAESVHRISTAAIMREVEEIRREGECRAGWDAACVAVLARRYTLPNVALGMLDAGPPPLRWERWREAN
jgi:hypothetical protein